VFIKTDQLDGETDWKLRRAVRKTQENENEADLMTVCGKDCVVANPPNDQIYEFTGVYKPARGKKESLGLENTVWANTVLASSGWMLCLVLHTGSETRMAMNTHEPRHKIGKVDLEMNRLSKILFAMMALISLVVIALDGFQGPWYFKFFRMILLLSSIIPISMRINLDFAKIYYCIKIGNDKEIEGCVARTTTIPEELGRI